MVVPAGSQEQSPLLALEVIDSGTERTATFCLLIIGAPGRPLRSSSALYQIVQGQTEFQTSIAHHALLVHPLCRGLFSFRLLTGSRRARLAYSASRSSLLALAFSPSSFRSSGALCLSCSA